MSRFAILLNFVVLIVCCSNSRTANCQTDPSTKSGAIVKSKASDALRVATFNVSMNRRTSGQLTLDLTNSDPQIRAIATIIRAVQPDIILLNEIDTTPTIEGRTSQDNAKIFAEKFLADTKPDLLGGQAWPMPYYYTAPVNTGEPSGLDINGNGKSSDPEDAWGFGNFPGQYGMAVLSRYPIDRPHVRSFQNLKWSQMPGALMPRDPATGRAYYAEDVWSQLRISSKSFWDVPIESPVGTIHFLVSHPTPPAFDGPADHNGCRNHDEVRLLVDYIDGDPDMYLVDDQGQRGGLNMDQLFVVAGDLNSDPIDGDSRHAAIKRLLTHARVLAEPIPESLGSVVAAQQQGKANLNHKAPPKNDTSDFSDNSVGNLRVDYCLPSRPLQIDQCGVFWPAEGTAGTDSATIKTLSDASDHHLVWVDVRRPK